MSNPCDVQLELQHIYLEVYAERFHHLRQFVEAYYCYKHGLVTRQGKADWEAIFWHGLVSEEAAKTNNRKEVVRDLLVPLPVLTGMMKTLVRDDEASLETIEGLLEEHLHFITITRREHQQLNKAGLGEKMPAGYYQPAHEFYQDLFARLKATGIKLGCVP